MNNIIKVLNIVLIVCCVLGVILGITEHNINAAIWAFNTLLWATSAMGKSKENEQLKETCDALREENDRQHQKIIDLQTELIDKKFK
jgi:hypothetical protein